jgi:hypothetical protein
MMSQEQSTTGKHMAEKPRLLKTSKKASALRQINAAIAHLHEGELDCAITLAAAAEGMLPDTKRPHLHDLFWNEFCPKAKAVGIDIDFNFVINWLKHKFEPENLYIPEGEATVVIARAITKFMAVYDEEPETLVEFLRRGTVLGAYRCGAERPRRSEPRGETASYGPAIPQASPCSTPGRWAVFPWFLHV